MQVTSTQADGLKRELTITIPASELAEKASRRLDELKGQVKLKGFRPGKVPVEHLRRLYGRSVMAEVVQESVTAANQQALTERKERPAFEPDIKFPESEDEITRIMEGKADLAYTVAFEILPDITLTDLAAIPLEKQVAEVTDEDTNKGVESLVDMAVAYEAAEGRKAAGGDRVTIDFVGRVDGAEFEGGKAEGQQVVLGRGGFIPGFEDGLIGAAAGEARDVTATFPETYGVKDLAGKTAIFAVKVTEVAEPKRPAIDDELAKKFGANDLAQLREFVTARVKQEFEQATRTRLKRALLDELDKRHADIALPGRLVDGEFESIWKQVTEGLEQAKRTFADEGKTEEGAREEYRKISERRVRLGLVLSAIGEKNEITVPEEAVKQAMFNEVRRYPGQEKLILEFYQKNPRAVAALRAPIFEDKVVDFVVELAKPTERKVTREELLKADEDDAPAAPA